MVAYLLLVGILLYYIVVGTFYAFIVDFVNLILSSLTTVYSTDVRFTLDASGIETGNILLTVFLFILIPLAILNTYWVLTKSQKPVQPY